MCSTSGRFIELCRPGDEPVICACVCVGVCLCVGVKKSLQLPLSALSERESGERERGVMV